MNKIQFVDINSIVNPSTGLTAREENEKKQHNIELGTLVEIENGCRLFVVAHERDWDGTPLYALSFNKEWEPNTYGTEYKTFARWQIDAGYPEESLKIIAK